MRKLNKTDIRLLLPGHYYVRLTKIDENRIKFEGLTEIFIRTKEDLAAVSINGAGLFVVTAIAPANISWPTASDRQISLSGNIIVQNHLMEIFK